MKHLSRAGAVLSAIVTCATLACAPQTAKAAAPLQAGCMIQAGNTQIKRVLHLTFDNVHLRRDNPNVPSDLEQMPNLLNFLLQNGVVSGNHHTPLISHTAHDITTALTGVYGSRSGIPVANSYGFFKPDGSVGFSSSFLYWTAPSGGSAAAGDGKPNFINELGKNAPAPWVPYTRAGCDFAGFSTANIELERVPQDVDVVFGANSPESVEAHSNATLASADFLGIAIHCAQNSPLCNNPNARPDLLPDEPNGYTGFTALYGNQKVQPVISPAGPVLDIDGHPITDGSGNPGFPGFSPTATQSLGYVATMLEAGVPVVYFYMADLHDSTNGSGAYGPGEAGYVAALKAYDAAGASSSRASRPTASPRQTRCSSLLPTKTITSQAVRRARRIATASTFPVATPSSARSTPSSTVCCSRSGGTPPRSPCTPMMRPPSTSREILCRPMRRRVRWKPTWMR
jgi:hypothetical protein